MNPIEVEIVLFLARFVMILFAAAAVAVSGWRIYTSMRFAAKHYGKRPFIIFALLILCVALALTFAAEAHSQTLSAVYCPHVHVTGNATEQCSVTLKSKATDDTTVALLGSVDALQPPPYVTIAKGHTTVKFTLKILEVQKTTSATLTAATSTSVANFDFILYGIAAPEHRVDLNWHAPDPINDIIGFHVYRGGSYLATTSALSYSDSSVKAGSAYNYTVRSIDSLGVESLDSNIASVKVPTP